MDLLDLSYSDLLTGSSLEKLTDTKELIEQLISCEPRACVDLYSHDVDAENPLDGNTVAVAADATVAQKESSIGQSVAKSDEEKQTKTEQDKLPKGEKEEQMGTKEQEQEKVEGTDVEMDLSPDIKTESGGRLDTVVSEGNSQPDTQFLEKAGDLPTIQNGVQGMGTNSQGAPEELFPIRSASEKGKRTVQASQPLPQLPLSSTTSSSYSSYTLPVGLDTYFALYIWALLAEGKQLDAAGLVKRYKDTTLFTDSKYEIVHKSAKAVYLLTRAYPAILSRFAYPCLTSKSNSSSEGDSNTTATTAEAIKKTRFNSQTIDYTAIYALKKEVEWLNPAKHGHLIINDLVLRTISAFEEQTYARLVTSFKAIRLSTLRQYLPLSSDWTASETVKHFTSVYKETGKWEIKNPSSWQDGKNEKGDDIILVPPPNSSSSLSSSSQKKQKQQQGSKNRNEFARKGIDDSLKLLVNATTYLEQAIPGFGSTD